MTRDECKEEWDRRENPKLVRIRKKKKSKDKMNK